MRSGTLIDLLRWGFLLVVTPLILATLAVVWFGNAELRKNDQERLQTTAETASYQLREIIDHSASFVTLLSLLQPEDSRCSDAIEGIKPPFKDAYSVVAIGGPEGRLLCASPVSAVGIDISDRPWFRQMVETGEVVVGGYQVSRATGDQEFVLARPGPQGVPLYIGLGIKLDYLSNYLAKDIGKDQGDIIVIDGDGRVVASSGELELGSTVDVAAVEGFSSMTLAGSQRDAFIRETNIIGMPFRVMVLAPEGDLLTLPEQLGFTLIILMLILGLITAIVGYQRIRRDVIEPIVHLRQMAPMVAAGKHKAIAPRATAPAEVKEAIIAFNDMFRELELKTTELEQASRMAGLGTWRLRTGARAFWISENIRALFGFPDQSVPIQDIEARIEAEDLEAFREAMRRLLDEGETVEIEFCARDAEDKIRRIRAQSGLHDAREADDKTPQMVGILQDITDLRSREQELGRSRALLRVGGDAARITGWRFNTGNGEFIEFSGPEWTQTVTLSQAFNQFAGEDRELIERSFWACAAGGIPFDVTVKHSPPQGEARWVRLIGEAERDQDGEIIVVHGALQDIDELVRARAASAEKEDLLRNILDFLDDGFLVKDLEGRVQYLNWQAQLILGLESMRNPVGRRIREGLDPKIAEALKQLKQTALVAKAKQTKVVHSKEKNKWIEINLHPTPSGVAIHVRDVTREREMQDRLRLLDYAVSRLNDTIIVTKADMIDGPQGPEIVYVNDAFYEMTGYKPDEVIGNTPRMLQGEKTERHRLDDIRLAIENKKPLRTELTNYRKDGSDFFQEIDITPLFNAAGECTHFVSVQRDITERREAEERLRASEEQFRLASMATEDIIWDWDMETDVMWNSAVAGNSSEGLSDWGIEVLLDRVHPEDREKVVDSLDTALSGGAQSWRQEFRYRNDEGVYREVVDRAFIVRASDGTPRRVVGAMTDVTEIRSLDAQLHQSQKLETVGKLTGGIAHDFNNLLTIILGNCDILLDEISEDSQLRPLIRSIEQAAERGAGVSTDLLAYARRQPLAARPTDINMLIRKSANLFDRAVDARIEMHYHLTDEKTVASVDPEKFQAALLNLVLNAQAAIPVAGGITVKTLRTAIMEDHQYECKPGNYVELQVIDDGVGMEPDVAARAFEPFFTTKEVGLGTGLGLSSVYGLVKQSGGHAHIESQPGQGTKVILCIPEDAGDEAAEVKLPGRKANSTKGSRILVVEDDSEVREYIELSLTKSGYKVRVAEDGTRALELLKSDDTFDLLITDVIMPGDMNGIQLAKRAKKVCPKLKMIFMSGYTRDELPKNGQMLSRTEIIYKPFRATKLVELIEKVLSHLK